MLATYKNLLEELSRQNSEVIVWKNVNELPDALAGKSDIDIYVRPRNRASFHRCISTVGFVNAFSPYSFPSVAHYYAYDDESGCFCHLHCYFRIVTGESHIKQFVLPLEPYLAEKNYRMDGTAFPELESDLQYRLACFRRQIKVSCIPGLLLYLRERDGYRSERVQLLSKLDDFEQTKQPENYGGWLGLVREQDSFLKTMVAGFKLRWQLRGLARLTSSERIIARYWTIAARVCNKIRHRRKRLSQGLVIAVVGLDGSGKSTAVDMLHDWLASDFDVHKIHYGQGSPTLLTLPLRIVLRIRRSLPGLRRAYTEEDRGPSADSFTNGWLPHLRYTGLALERYKLLSTANRTINRGGIVVSDRWRSLDRGKMDSARLDPAESGMQGYLARLEDRLYKSSMEPDLLLKMVVREETAIQRNRDRDKPGKETDEGISARFRVNGSLNYHAETLIEIDGEQSMEAVHSLLRRSVWDAIKRRNCI